MPVLADNAINQLFTEAHTEHHFSKTNVSDEVIHQLYELAKLGPTGFNAQQARYLFIRSQAQKEKLVAHVSSANREKNTGRADQADCGLRHSVSS